MVTKQEIEQAKVEEIKVKPDSLGVSVTADVCLFGFIDGQLKVLLIKRTVDKFKDCWLLAGGVMEEDENIYDTAHKVLDNLIGVDNIKICQVKSYTDVDRHPVKRVVTISFYALIKPENHPMIKRSGITEFRWFSLRKLPAYMGFDHLQIVRDAHFLLKRNLETDLVFGELLPKEFTLNELQMLYESILEKDLDKRNFRKKIFQMDILENTGKINKDSPNKEYLYRKIDYDDLGF